MLPLIQAGGGGGASGTFPSTIAKVATKFLDSYSSITGLFTQTQPDFTDLSGTATTAQIPNLSAAKITSGVLALAQGGTGVDLSAAGGATFVLAQDGSHVISARALIAADIPNLSAAKITSGLLGLAQGGTGVDLSATGGATSLLAQNASHVITARVLVGADLPNPSASTLGGVQSLAVVASKWINTISTAGVPAATQPAFTDISASLAGSQLPTTFEGAGTGFFNNFYGCAIPPAAGASVGLTTLHLFFQTVVVYPITVRKITFKVNGAVAASKVYIALYDSTGTLVANSSNLGAAGTSAVIVVTTLGTPFTINPGIYFVFIQADTTGITVDGSASAAVLNNTMNQNVSRMGTCANGVSGAAVPGTLGALTPSSLSIPQILFEA